MFDRYVWVFPPDPHGKEPWQWPAAFYNGPNRKMAAMVVCERPYDPLMERLGGHPHLGVIIKRYNTPKDVNNEGRNMLCDIRFTRLRFLIEFTQDYLDKNHHWNPKII